MCWCVCKIFSPSLYCLSLYTYFIYINMNMYMCMHMGYMYI